MPPGSKAEGIPRLIAIAGPSCSGKTTLARALLTFLHGSATVLSMDSYYRDLSPLSPTEKANFNFDNPEALDYPLLSRDLGLLSAGHPVTIPVYDFATHARQATTEHIEPTIFIIVEGLFALYWPEINTLYSLRIFIDTDDTTCLNRRIARDAAERGRSAATIHTQYIEHVRPMYDRFIKPTSHNADLHLDGNSLISKQTRGIVQWIGNNLPKY